MSHPFADLIDLRIDEQAFGATTLSLTIAKRHLNPHEVVHGAVIQ